MFPHKGKGCRITDPVIEGRRALKVGKHDDNVADINVISRAQDVTAEKIAECLIGDRPVGGQDIPSPDLFFKHEDPVDRKVIVDDQLAPAGNDIDSDIIFGEFNRNAIAFFNIEIKFQTGFQGAGPVGAGGKCYGFLPAGSGTDSKLGLDMGVPPGPNRQYSSKSTSRMALSG